MFVGLGRLAGARLENKWDLGTIGSALGAMRRTRLSPNHLVIAGPGRGPSPTCLLNTPWIGTKRLIREFISVLRPRPDVGGALPPLPFGGGCVSPDCQAFPKPRATGGLRAPSSGILCRGLKRGRLFLWFASEPRPKWRNHQLQIKHFMQTLLRKKKKIVIMSYY